MQVPLLDLKAQYRTIRNEVRHAIDKVCEAQAFILGPGVKSLEEDISSYCGARFAIGVASGSDALLISLVALGVGPGDAVITTPYTFFATAGSIRRIGAWPVFVDIDPYTYNIDPKAIEEACARHDEDRAGLLKAIMPVHLYGQMADMDPIMEVARNYGLAVVEDAAQAIGADYRPSGKDAGKPKKAGTIGTLGCFSFFPSKNLGGFGDGGMVVTDDEALGRAVRILRVHGSEPKYYHKVVGMNSRLDALQAAVLRIKLRHLDAWTEGRQRNARRYDEGFEGLRRSAGLVTPIESGKGRHIYNQYVIRAPKRDALVEFLKDNGIGCEIYYPVPLHLQECFRDLGYCEGALPESELAARETLALPVYPELTEEMQDYVVETIDRFYRT